MGYKATSPESANVPVLQPKTLGEYRIYSIHIRISPNNPAETGIGVDFAEGFSENGIFTPINRQSKYFSGAPMQAAITAEVEPGSTRYDEVKKGVWDMLKTEGLVPEGNMI